MVNFVKKRELHDTLEKNKWFLVVFGLTNRQKIIQNHEKRGLKIDWFLVSILDHFFSLFDLQRAPNRLQNAPKMSPEA